VGAVVTHLVDALIAAWVRWEAAPRAAAAAANRFAAIHALGLPAIDVHNRVAAARRAGMSIPDAVQTLINDQAKEAA